MASPSTSSPLQRKQPKWRPDESSDLCFCCRQQFSMWNRRHHCRACGELVCAPCSPYLDRLPEYGYESPVRVCKDCKSSHHLYASSPETCSSDSEAGEVDEALVTRAVDVISSHSTKKHSKLSYQYFVQSEAVNWLVDSGIVKSRSMGSAVFNRLLDDGHVTVKPWSGFMRSTFYILREDPCGIEARVSHYESALHSETSKCRNCSQSFLESLTSTPGYCSIDCKTNAIISMDDSARIRRYYQ